MDPNTKKCPVCQSEIKENDAFCLACGAKLPTGETAAAASNSAVSAAPVASAVQPNTTPAANPGLTPDPVVAKPAAPANAPVNMGSTLNTNTPVPPVTASPAAPFVSSAPVQNAAPQPVAPVTGATAPASPAAPAFGQTAAPYGTPTTQPAAPTNGYSAPGAPQAPAQPQGYSAPGMQQPPPYQQPAQPGGYGAPQPQQGGYGAPPAQPGGYGGFTPATPPPKKKNTSLVVVLSIVGVLLVGGAIALFLIISNGQKAAQERMRQAALDEEYARLVTTITSSTTPRQVARHRSDLDAFFFKSPLHIEDDLEELVTVCETYEESSKDDENTFITMLDALDALEGSSNPEIAACATTLITAVNADYDKFLANDTSNPSVNIPSASGSSPGQSGSEPFTQPFPYRIIGDTIVLSEIDGEPVFSLTYENLTDKTITYMELWVFVYDKNGNRLDGDYEWVVDSPDIAPGDTHTPEKNGYFDFYTVDGTQVALGLPFINYIEFSDGSSWGITYFDGDSDEQYDLVMAQIDRLQAVADETAPSMLQSAPAILTKKNEYILNPVLTKVA